VNHLHGTVRGTHRHPLAGCIVKASGDGVDACVVTDEHGRFKFDFEAKDGWSYSLKFEIEGYHPCTMDGVTAGDNEYVMEPVA